MLLVEVQCPLLALGAAELLVEWLYPLLPLGAAELLVKWRYPLLPLGAAMLLGVLQSPLLPLEAGRLTVELQYFWPPERPPEGLPLDQWLILASCDGPILIQPRLCSGLVIAFCCTSSSKACLLVCEPGSGSSVYFVFC